MIKNFISLIPIKNNIIKKACLVTKWWIRFNVIFYWMV